MKEQMLYLAGIYGKRFTEKGKTKFLNFISKRIRDLGYQVQLDSRENGWKHTCNNLLIGDVKKADVIVTVPYDTASKVLIPGYCYYPLNRKKNMTSETVNIILQSLLAVTMLLLYYSQIFHKNINGFSTESILAFLGMALVVFVALKLAIGISNKYNFNRNTASIVVLMSLIELLDKRKRIAFAMTDRTCNSYEGYRQLADYLGENASKKEVIILDCIGTNSTLFVACCETYANRAKERIKYYFGSLDIRLKELSQEVADGTALYFFPRGTYLLGGKEEKGEIVVTNSRSGKDSHVDFDKMRQTQEFLNTYLS